VRSVRPPPSCWNLRDPCFFLLLRSHIHTNRSGAGRVSFSIRRPSSLHIVRVYLYLSYGWSPADAIVRSECTITSFFIFFCADSLRDDPLVISQIVSQSLPPASVHLSIALVDELPK